MGTTSQDTTPSQSKQLSGFLVGLFLVVLLGFAARWVKGLVYNASLPFDIPGKALEYPLWAVLLGLAANVLLKLSGFYEHIRPGFRTELFLKIGLVLLGAGISFKEIVTAGGGAIIQALILVTAVYFFTWWLAGKFGIVDTLRAVMSTAIAVCGVSAAIAAAGSVLAKKEETTYVTTLVILTAIPLMVILPILAGWMGMPEPVAGAWFGGNVDTTAAVVGAATIYGETAQKIASIVKSAQNTLIGVVAFLLALYFSSKSGSNVEKPSLRLIWQRFPKFVLGFIVTSLLFTFAVIPAVSKDLPTAGDAIKAMKDWAFCLAFVSMGLELSYSNFRAMGWKPVWVYFIATLFNTILALVVAWLIFGGVITI
jgi:uncharacterized membrane protein YadS